MKQKKKRIINAVNLKKDTDYETSILFKNVLTYNT